jgi:hypothetical protein
MKDYSQYGEQKYILQALGRNDPHYPLSVGDPYIKPGRLLEIGAFDPFAMSNSRALIELGWSAVIFEPSPGPLKSLVKEYGNNPKVEVVGLPVSLPDFTFMKLRITDDAVSADATNQAHLKKWEGYGFYGTMTTYAVPLDRVFDLWGPFDFVSIDTEGTSVDLFMEMCRLVWYAGNENLPLKGRQRPRCVVVEHDNRWDEMRKAAELGGYRLMHDPKENGTNVVLELKP